MNLSAESLRQPSACWAPVYLPDTSCAPVLCAHPLLEVRGDKRNTSCVVWGSRSVALGVWTQKQRAEEGLLGEAGVWLQDPRLSGAGKEKRARWLSGKTVTGEWAWLG